MRAGCLAIAVLLVMSCASAARSVEITSARAIEIARAQVRWEPFESSVVRARAGSRAVWRVTMKGRLPGQPPLLFETAVIDVDAASGTVLRIAKT